MQNDPKSTTNKTIDQKIAALKRKKRKLQQEQAVILLRKLKQILGKEYSPELVCAIASSRSPCSPPARGRGQAWHNANTQEKEVWRSNAYLFCQRNYDKTIQTRTEDPQQASGSSTKEVPTHDER